MPRRALRRLGVLIATIALVGASVPLAAAPASAAVSAQCTSMTQAQVQARILSETNAARSKAGLKALSANSQMNTVAINWSGAQAAANRMSHNPNYSKQIPAGWHSAGENVAFGYAATRVTTGWLNSPGHRANILGSFTHIGIGVACSAGGHPYYTQVFGAYRTAPANPAPAPAPAPSYPNVSRLAGADRYATAAAISKSTFGSGVPVVYLASGATFPDALSGASSAGVVGGPVLLTPPTALSASAKTELSRLKPQRIVVLGGPGAVSSAVVKAAGAYTSGPVRRAAGDDRYETSAAISAATFDPGVPIAYLSNGQTFPDALSGAAAAGVAGGPVLLTKANGIPASVAAELQRLQPRKVVVLGGTGAVTDAVLKAAGAYTPGTVSRVSGPDRYATAAAVSKSAFGAGVPKVYIANGTTFPDALSGAAVAGVTGGPVLLTGGTSLPSSVTSELARLKPRKIVVLGGPGAVSDGLLGQLAKYATG